MRKITKQAVEAFEKGYNFKSGNTKVVGKAGGIYLKLHDNTIAFKSNEGVIEISTCGWNTPTTRERLNGIPGVSVNQRNGILYLNGNRWDNHETLTKVN